MILRLNSISSSSIKSSHLILARANQFLSQIKTTSTLTSAPLSTQPSCTPLSATLSFSTTFINRSNPSFNSSSAIQSNFNFSSSSVHSFYSTMSASTSTSNSSESPQKQKVAIIGSGNWGSAIAKIAGNNVLKHKDVFEERIDMYVYEEMVSIQISLPALQSKIGPIMGRLAF